MSKILKINLYEKFSENLSARIYGKTLFEEIKKNYDSNTQEKIIFNFEKIEIISSGFSKELFGELLLFFGKETFRKIVKIQISNNPNKDIIKTIIYKGLKTVENDIKSN